MTERTARDKAQANTEIVNHLVLEVLTAAHDIVRRHRLTSAECDALQALLTHVRADDKRSSVLDAVVERIIANVANADRQGREGVSGRATMADIARANKSITGHVYSADRFLTTVLFTDIVDSTRRAAELGDRNWLALLERHDEIARAEVERFRGRVVKHTGDGIVAIFDGPSRAVQSAAALTDCIPELGIGVRCGLHAGECELRGNDIGGIAVHTGARIAALARTGEVLVSNTVKDLVNGSGIIFQDRGRHVLKGVPGEWTLFTCNQFTTRNGTNAPWPASWGESAEVDEARVAVLPSKGGPRSSSFT